MNTDFSLRDLCGVFAVPPLARRAAAAREIDFSENDRIVRHVLAGGIRSLIYGGNAFLYHLTLGEYDQLLGWLSLWDRELWLIPSVGPSFGRAMDQAQILRRYQFKCVMVLPCGDPRDAPGLELGYSEFVEASGVPLIIYLKEENSFGADRIAGLDAIARLVNEKQCIGIKYAIVREHPRDDPYLEALLDRVDKKLVINGIGEPTA